jgi:hypothetical protein
MTGLSRDGETHARLLEAEAELRALRAENTRFRELSGLDHRGSRPEGSGAAARPALFPADDGVAAKRHEVSQSSGADEKTALFRSLFVGRDDVHALAWSNRATGSGDSRAASCTSVTASSHRRVDCDLASQSDAVAPVPVACATTG